MEAGHHNTGWDNSRPTVLSCSRSSAEDFLSLCPLWHRSKATPTVRKCCPNSCLSRFFGLKKPTCSLVSQLKGPSSSGQAPHATLSHGISGPFLAFCPLSLLECPFSWGGLREPAPYTRVMLNKAGRRNLNNCFI